MPEPTDPLMRTLDRMSLVLDRVVAGQAERSEQIAEFRGAVLGRLDRGDARFSELERSVQSVVPRVAVLEAEAARKRTPPGGQPAARATLDSDATGALARVVVLDAEREASAEKLRAARWKTLAAPIGVVALAIATVAASALTRDCAGPARATVAP